MLTNALTPDYILERMPYASESDFFKSNLNVSGMAASDNKVILNPYSTLSEREKEAVAKNERARIWMRVFGSPKFYITPEQNAMFKSYGNLDDIKSTIAARIYSGDPSAGIATKEQSDWVFRNLILSGWGKTTP